MIVLVSKVFIVYHEGFSHFLYLCARRFSHTVTVSCDEFFRDFLCGLHDSVVCVIYVKADCVFCSRWCFDVMDDAINGIFHLFGRRCIVRMCCVRRNCVVAAVGNSLQPLFCSIRLYGSG